MFRKAVQNSIKPNSVARFLLLDPIFPRSVRYCLDGISNTLKTIDTSPSTENPSELEDMLRKSQSIFSLLSTLSVQRR